MQLIQTLDRTPRYDERIEITTTGIARPSAAYRNNEDLNAIFLTIEDNNIRYRVTGEDPDANNGHTVVAGNNIYFVDKMSIRELRMIAIGGTAYAYVTYYV